MITIAPVNKNYYEGFDMSGHADVDDYGKDIVCASVSGAFYVAYLALCNMIGREHVRQIIEGGHARVEIEHSSEGTDAIIDGFLELLHGIKEDYPNALSIKGDSNHEERL